MVWGKRKRAGARYGNPGIVLELGSRMSGKHETSRALGSRRSGNPLRMEALLYLSFEILLLVSSLSAECTPPGYDAHHRLRGAEPRTGVTSHRLYVLPDGHLYVYDMDDQHRLLKHLTIPTSRGTRGVVGHAGKHMLYISYGSDGDSGGSLLAYDLLTDTVAWNRSYGFGIDSHAITPDGRYIYMPSGEASKSPDWHVIDATNGRATGARLRGGPGPHNTLISLDGRHVYMGARNFANAPTYLTVADTASNRTCKQIGPFKSGIRPFTIDGFEKLAYVTVTGLLGFQIADITTGKVVYTQELPRTASYTGSTPSAPSHGIALSPLEDRLAVIDRPNGMVHMFDVTGDLARVPAKDRGYYVFPIHAPL